MIHKVSMNSPMSYQTFDSQPGFTVKKTVAAAMIAFGGLALFALSLSFSPPIKEILAVMAFGGAVLAIAMMNSSRKARVDAEYVYPYRQEPTYAYELPSPIIHEIHPPPVVVQTPVYSYLRERHVPNISIRPSGLNDGARVPVGGGHRVTPPTFSHSPPPIRPSGLNDGARVPVGGGHRVTPPTFSHSPPPIRSSGLSDGSRVPVGSR